MVRIGIGHTPSVRLMAKSLKSRRSRTRGQDKHRPRRRWPWLLGAGGLLAILLVGAYSANRSAQPATPPQIATQPPAAASDPSLGPASAPVTLIEYGDFGCTTCRAWEKAGILKAARQEYGDKLRFVWRDFPVTPARF